MNENNYPNDEELEQQLEENRRRKIENFKINFGDDFFGNTVTQDDTVTEIKSFDEKPEKIEEENSLFSESIEFMSEAPSETAETDKEEITSHSTVGVNHQYTEEELRLLKKKKKAALKAEKNRKRMKSKKNRHIFTLIRALLVVVLGLSIGKFGIIGAKDFLAIERTSTDIVTVNIPKKPDAKQVAEILEKAGVIDNSFFFTQYAKITNADKGFRQGVFEIVKNKDYEAIINFLQSNANRKDIVTIQFSEGMSVESIAKKLSDEEVCDYDEFLELCKSDKFDSDYDFLAQVDPNKRYYKLEGYLFPDTYDFYKGEPAEDSISRFLANFKNKCINEKKKISGYDKRVNIRKRAQLQDFTLDDIITLASIIQKESADDNDMLYVSSVFRNRLDTIDNDGYSIYDEYNLSLLQSEAVYYYMETLPEGLHRYFNTDENAGLPGGAICSPGMSAIEAALNPKDTDYYYFCHKSATEDEAAESYYASTLDQHNYNLTLIEEE